MPTHAILGATGGVGSAIVHNLLESKTPNLNINLLVRSKQKLLNLVPGLESPPSNITVNIFEGSISDNKTLSACLKNTAVIYSCVSGSAPAKETTTARDAAQATVSALEDLQKTTGKSYEKPTVLLNRSSALNPSIKVPVSTPFYYFLKWSLQDLYADLTATAEIYQNSPSLLHYIFVDAPNLFHPFEATNKTGYEVFETGDITLGVNYSDFGAATVEIAERREEFRGKAVGVRAAGTVEPAWGPNVSKLAAGAWVRLRPW